MFIYCNHKFFKISSTLKNLLISSGYFPIEKSQTQIFQFSEPILLRVFYYLIPVTEFKHCYVLVSGSPNKNRINKEFYSFLKILHKRETVSEIKKLDKFYTKPEIADFCVVVFKKYFNIKKNDIIIEPSAGNGSFFKSLNNMDCKKYYFDIAPENHQIVAQDFLKYTLLKKNYKIHVIGNPPFGKQSSTAVKFIQHAASFADSISFILPKSFRKESLKSKVPLNFHLMHEEELPPNSFFF